MKEDFKYELDTPEGVQVTKEQEFLVVKGPKGELKKKIYHPAIKITVKNNQITLECKKATKREKTLINTLRAHIRNILIGVKEPFIYKLKICAGPPQSHFPVQVTLKDSVFSVKNFLGEKIPRELTIRTDAKVEVKGNDITVESSDIDAAGRTASEIELLMRTRERDKRIFQDGIYIVEKP